MGKPFVMQGEAAANEGTQGDAVRLANVGRGPDGKFARLEAPQAGEVVEEAKDTGVPVQEAVRANRVPDKEVGSNTPNMSGGDAVYEESLPWPEAGQYNDANKPPMKLKG